MKGVFLIAVMCFSCVIPTTANLDHFINELATIIVAYIETLFKARFKEYVLQDQQNIPFNVSSVIEGDISFQKIYLYGLDGLLVNNENININLDSTNQTLIIGLNISIPDEVGIRIEEYVVDLGLLDSIPVYGSGNLSASAYSVNTGIYAEISFKDSLNLTYFEIRPFLSGVKVDLSGFWNNPELSTIISDVLTLAIDAFVIAWDFEIDCITCAISSLVESYIHQVTFLDHLHERCQNICVLSNYSLVKMAFNDNISEFWESISKDDVAKYIETGADYLTKEIECYLVDK